MYCAEVPNPVCVTSLSQMCLMCIAFLSLKLKILHLSCIYDELRGHRRQHTTDQLRMEVSAVILSTCYPALKEFSSELRHPTNRCLQVCCFLNFHYNQWTIVQQDQ